MVSKGTTREEEPIKDLRATEKETASKFLRKFIGRQEEEKVVVTRGRAGNALRWAIRRWAARCRSDGDFEIPAKRRRYTDGGGKEAKERMPMTLEAWMPTKVELT